MKNLLIILATATAALSASAQQPTGHQQPQFMECRLDAKAENGTGISCTGVEWPPRLKINLPATGIVDAKHPRQSENEVSKPYRNSAGRLCVRQKGLERCLGDREIPKVRFREVADRKYWATVALDIGLAAYAVEGAQHCQRAGTCEEANGILGHSRGQQYTGKMLLTVLIPAFGKYYWKKWDMEDRRLGYKGRGPGWWLPAIISPVTNFVDGTLEWRYRGKK